MPLSTYNPKKSARKRDQNLPDLFLIPNPFGYFQREKNGWFDVTRKMKNDVLALKNKLDDLYGQQKKCTEEIKLQKEFCANLPARHLIFKNINRQNIEN